MQLVFLYPAFRREGGTLQMLRKSIWFSKDSDAGRDWGQEEKGTTEDEMAGWHHRLNALEFG